MDGYLILECQSRESAAAVLDAINVLAGQWWQSQDFTVQDGQLVGRNAATGEDEPGSARTITWDTVKESLDGTFYLTSLRNDPRFVDGIEMLPAEVRALFEERPFPEAWTPTGIEQ